MNGKALKQLLESHGSDLAMRCARQLFDRQVLYSVGPAIPHALARTLRVKYQRALRLGFTVVGLAEFIAALEGVTDDSVGIVRVPPEGPDYFTVITNETTTAIVAVLEAHSQLDHVTHFE